MNNYFVKCPFCDPRDNKVDLEICRGCFWNDGVLEQPYGVPQKVICKHEFIDHRVEILRDNNG